jgi:hypothetical protein
MENNQANLVKHAATYGAILGAIVVIYSFILYVLKIMPIGFFIPVILFIASLAIYFAGIFLGTKKIKNEILGGVMTYSQGLQIGVLIAFFAAVITAFYSYLQNTLIDPDYIVRVMNAQKDWMSSFMISKGIPEDQIEKSLALIDENMKDMNHVKNLFVTILSSTIFGFAISLITSALLKKLPNLFDESHSVQ